MHATLRVLLSIFWSPRPFSQPKLTGTAHAKAKIVIVELGPFRLRRSRVAGTSARGGDRHFLLLHQRLQLLVTIGKKTVASLDVQDRGRRWKRGGRGRRRPKALDSQGRGFVTVAMAKGRATVDNA